MTIQIKTKSGEIKQYSTVAERLTALHEAGKTLEVLESAPVAVGDGFIWRVLLKVDNLTYVGNAEVHLNSTNFAEKADPFATAETSAVGRALAWCGYAGTPDNPSIASADEVIRAQAQQNGNKQPQSPALSELISKAKTRAKTLSLATDKATWEAFLQEVTGEVLTDKDLTLALVARVNGRITQIERERGVAAK